MKKILVFVSVLMVGCSNFSSVKGQVWSDIEGMKYNDLSRQYSYMATTWTLVALGDRELLRAEVKGFSIYTTSTYFQKEFAGQYVDALTKVEARVKELAAQDRVVDEDVVKVETRNENFVKSNLHFNVATVGMKKPFTEEDYLLSIELCIGESLPTCYDKFYIWPRNIGKLKALLKSYEDGSIEYTVPRRTI